LAIGYFVLGLGGDAFRVLWSRNGGKSGKRAQRVVDLAWVWPDWWLGNRIVGHSVG
jgi:hypothetical protein